MKKNYIFESKKCRIYHKVKILGIQEKRVIYLDDGIVCSLTFRKFEINYKLFNNIIEFPKHYCFERNINKIK